MALKMKLQGLDPESQRLQKEKFQRRNKQTMDASTWLNTAEDRTNCDTRLSNLDSRIDQLPNSQCDRKAQGSKTSDYSNNLSSFHVSKSYYTKYIENDNKQRFRRFK